VAIKNVTINEPFFQGHFPGYPIMPGVLVVEAMAQAGGIIMMAEIPDHEKKAGGVYRHRACQVSPPCHARRSVTHRSKRALVPHPRRPH